MADKIMAFGRELLVTPDTLGVHTSESEDKLLDIPLVADKIGKYDEDDIDEISENLAKLKHPTELIFNASVSNSTSHSVPDFTQYSILAFEVIESNGQHIYTQLYTDLMNYGEFHLISGQTTNVKLIYLSIQWNNNNTIYISANGTYTLKIYGIK